MDDGSILELFFSRSEAAISATAEKYGKYCYNIAYRILSSAEDSEESVNDTYMAAWNAIPPRRPDVLSAFLGRLTRNISLDKWKRRSAQKRGGGEVPLALEELVECIPGGEDPEAVCQKRELVRCINRFLAALPETERKIFTSRYYHLRSAQQIAETYGFTLSKTASMLHRTREKLGKYLMKEGF